jgi:hypothetical protein
MLKKSLKISLLLTAFLIAVTSTWNPGRVTAAPVYPISATADSQAKSGIPGSVVSYTVTLAYPEGPGVSVTLDGTTAGGWPAPTIVPAVLTFVDNSPQSVTVNVPVPATATNGQNDVVTILVKDGSANVMAEPLMLRTTANVPTASGRPIVTVSSYSSSPNPIIPYQEFTLSVVFENRGQSGAQNLIVTFDGTDLYPSGTGGVSTVSFLGSSGDKVTFTQKFLAGGNLSWAEAASVKATATYSDSNGQAYTEAFNLTLGIKQPTYYATATSTVKNKPQLMITGYKTDIDPLQPGSIFNLKLDITNLGTSDAKAVTMVIGGGATPGDQSGTQQPGGVSGSSGDLTNFAPLGSSNLAFIGDLKQGGSSSVSVTLVTNVSTQPGAYTLKVSFVYDDGKGNRLVDDQVITLLVYALPQVEVSFYRDAGMFSAGMSNMLPLQVTNLGKRTAVLGNMRVTAGDATLNNATSLVGALDPGGYYTLDTEIIPVQEGPLDVVVTINYTDDFNQPRTIDQTITIDVLPAQEIQQGLEGQNGSGMQPAVPVETQPETFWAKVVRFIKGLFGLGSGDQTTPIDGGKIVPTEIISPIRPGKG